MSSKRDFFIENLDSIRLLFDEGAVMSVLDPDGICVKFSIPEWMPPTMKTGEKVFDPTGAFDRCVSEKKVQHNILPKEAMGMAMEGNLVPILEDGEVCCVLISTYVVDDKLRREELEKAFQESMSKVNLAVNDVTAKMEKMSSNLENLIEKTEAIERDVQTATSVVTNVGKNASKSKILALNATIEAARSGEAGRGFSVVAGEMGKLATESNASATQIKNTLDGIVEHLQGISEDINGVGKEAIENTRSIESINEILDEAFKAAEM